MVSLYSVELKELELEAGGAAEDAPFALSRFRR